MPPQTVGRVVRVVRVVTVVVASAYPSWKIVPGFSLNPVSVSWGFLCFPSSRYTEFHTHKNMPLSMMSCDQVHISVLYQIIGRQMRGHLDSAAHRL